MSLPLVERGISAFKGFAAFFENDVPAIFASVKDRSGCRRRSQRPTPAPPRRCATWPTWLESQRATATGELRARSREVREDALRHRARDDAARRARGGGSRRPRAQSGGARATRARSSRLAQPCRQCIEKMNANKPRGGAVAGARAQLAELKKFVARRRRRHDSRHRRSAGREAPPYNRENFAYIDIPGPYEKGMPADLLHRAARSVVAGEEQRDYVPGGRTCSSPRCTKCGPATSCSSCTRTAIRRSSAGSSSATPSPKAGRTTPRR